MRVVSVVGTRPQLIKAAALQPVLRHRHREVFVDTGQHWDEAMAGTFFRELGLARPDHFLGAGGGSRAQQVASMLTGLEPLLQDVHPDAVIVYGDTNSTLAGALCAAKLAIPVAHVEAGLRSFDRRMPEELNRIVVDHLSTWAFAPTPAAVVNLRREGVASVSLVGDLMRDLAARVAAEVRGAGAALAAAAAALRPRLEPGVLAPGRYLLATIHRQENREPGSIRQWAGMLARLARPDRPVILPLHPGTVTAVAGAGVSLPDDVLVVEPTGYRTSLALQLHAAAVLTDSGGVQREAAWLGVPCLVLRRSTEWVETLEGSAGQMVLVGLDADLASQALATVAPNDRSGDLARARAARLDLRADGAAERIVGALEGPPG